MSENMIETTLDADGIFTLTLNRPEKKNALDLPAQRAMREALYDASRNPGVHVVVLTGAGGTFSAGGDIRVFGKADATDPIAQQWADDPRWISHELRLDRLKKNIESSLLLYNMGKPTIAMVRGVAAGAGLSLALACDFRIAAENAAFLTSFAKIGVCGDYGGSYFLAKLVGPSKAKELYMFGERLDARAAAELGMLNRVVPDERLEQETYAFARRLAKSAPIALRYIKENINVALDLPVEQALVQESRNMIRTLESEDSREAVKAFQEKRDPVFQGR